MVGTTLGDLVSGKAHICGPETTLSEASRAMAAEGHGSLGVVDGRAVVGVLTERDVVRALAGDADPTEATVAEWMGRDPDVFDPATDVFDAAAWLLESGYRHLPVMAGAELLGIVSLRDLLRAIMGLLDEGPEEE